MKGGGAAIREVLMPAFGVLKNRQPFDPSWASREAQRRAWRHTILLCCRWCVTVPIRLSLSYVGTHAYLRRNSRR